VRFIVIGNIGSDAGYWVIDANGIHHVGGWGIEQMAEFSTATQILRQAVQLKTPGLAEAAVKSVLAFAEGQLKQNLQGGATGQTVVLVA